MQRWTHMWKVMMVKDKVSADIKKNLIANLYIIKKNLKTKIKCHGDEVINFYGKKIPNVDSNHTYLAVISLDSALEKDDNDYLQMFLKECKYIKKKIFRHITQDRYFF